MKVRKLEEEKWEIFLPNKWEHLQVKRKRDWEERKRENWDFCQLVKLTHEKNVTSIHGLTVIKMKRKWNRFERYLRNDKKNDKKCIWKSEWKTKTKMKQITINAK